MSNNLAAHVPLCLRLSVESAEIDLSEFQNDDDSRSGDATEAGDGQAATAPPEPASETPESGEGSASKQAKKLVITDEEFQTVTQALVMRLRQHEETVMQEGTGLVGMKQKDLIQWYVEQQNQKNAYSSMAEVNSEVTQIRAIIESLIRREGYLIVVDDGRQVAAGEQATTRRDDRILAVAPNYAVD